MHIFLTRTQRISMFFEDVTKHVLQAYQFKLKNLNPISAPHRVV
jgi:hypothetical protein